MSAGQSTSPVRGNRHSAVPDTNGPGAFHDGTVCCANCLHFSLRQAGHELAHLGYGRCAHERERGRFLSARYPRPCAGFACATPPTIERREAIIHHKEQHP